MYDANILVSRPYGMYALVRFSSGTWMYRGSVTAEIILHIAHVLYQFFNIGR